jgi:cell division protease FtsH
VDRPDKLGRKAILQVHMKKIKVGPDVDPDLLSNMTPGMVGADLANLVNEAALLAVRRGKKEVELAEFEEAVERIVAGLEKKNRLINPKERETVAYHEMGHAIVALSLPGTDPVQKISIIPRGISALGYTMQVPTEDRFLMKKTELLNKITSLLGGRAAEEIIFGDISTGAHNDLARATDIAGSMIREYGMSAALGQVYLSPEKRPQFLGVGMRQGGEYSEDTAKIIDREIREIISGEYGRALEILNSRKDVLVSGAQLLLEQEKIDGEQIKALIA